MSMLSSVTPWNAVAEGYASTSMGVFRGYSEAALDLLAVEGGRQILDNACGPGTLALAAAELGARVDAVDFSPNMLAQLEAQLDLHPNSEVTPICADGQSLPFEDERFDAAFSMFGLMFFPDRARGYAEMRRTLKPHGRICISSWARLENSPLLELMWTTLQAINPDIPDPQYDTQSLENPELLKAELEGAGFGQVEIHTVRKAVSFESAQGLWDTMARGSAPVVMMKAALEPDAWRACEAKAIAHIQAATASTSRLEAEAYLGIAIK